MTGSGRRRAANTIARTGKTRFVIECPGNWGSISPARVLDLARRDDALAEPLDADGEMPAQVVYAVREEMAFTMKDIILRRTGIGTPGYPGAEVIEKVAAIAAGELGWDDDRRATEISLAREALTLPR